MLYLSVFYNYILDKLSRTTSGGNLIPEIDGLRFIAIAPVVVFHTFGVFLVLTNRFTTWENVAKYNWFVHLISHGNYGVQLFFVISGFILSLPFARQHFNISKGPSMKSYFLRRVSRLEPTYVINLLIMYIIRPATSIVMLPYLLASIFYIHNMYYAEVSRISDVTWSLEIEIQFYILAPVFAMVYKISNKYFRRMLILFVILFSIYLPLFISAGPRYNLSLINYLQYFGCGFLLTDIFLVDWKECPEKKYAGDLVTFFSIILLLLSMYDILDVKLFLPVSILIAFIGTFTGKISNYFYTRKPIVVIGGMCYTIYLYHNTIITLFVHRIIKLTGAAKGNTLLDGFGIYLIIMTSLILLFSSILFLLFEKPFMRKEWYKKIRFKSVAF
jgi:peptidoglycan/LPS O-acetylase OafA/YrhL